MLSLQHTGFPGDKCGQAHIASSPRDSLRRDLMSRQSGGHSSHSFSRRLLSTYCVLHSGAGAGDATVWRRRSPAWKMNRDVNRRGQGCGRVLQPQAGS